LAPGGNRWYSHSGIVELGTTAPTIQPTLNASCIVDELRLAASAGKFSPGRFSQDSSARMARDLVTICEVPSTDAGPSGAFLN
jgi:hypothetical protein